MTVPRRERLCGFPRELPITIFFDPDCTEISRTSRKQDAARTVRMVFELPLKSPLDHWRG